MEMIVVQLLAWVGMWRTRANLIILVVPSGPDSELGAAGLRRLRDFLTSDGFALGI